MYSCIKGLAVLTGKIAAYLYCMYMWSICENICFGSLEIASYGDNDVLGAGHMSRASPANRADLSHENLYFSTT